MAAPKRRPEHGRGWRIGQSPRRLRAKRPPAPGRGAWRRVPSAACGAGRRRGSGAGHAALVGACWAVLGGCGAQPGAVEAALPPPGASWTRARQPANSLIAPARHLDADGQLAFYGGFSFFRSPWVAPPASTTARDGLGPLFNSHSCAGCHRNGGRGRSLLDDPHSLATVVRLSVRGDGGDLAPHPRYGSQFQTQATYAGGAEARIAMQSIPVAGSLRKPALTVEAADGIGHGEGWLLSARVAPPLMGLGLLERIAEERLLALADADDADGDGISGRPHWRPGTAGRRLGRFGWKALHPSVAAQTGAAFRDDLGVTNPLFPGSPCGALQTRCQRQPDGNDRQEGVEIPTQLFDLVVHFVAHIPPPPAGALTAAVREGRRAFGRIGCAACHVPSHETAAGRIWPYTDLLLHDMGEGLADHRPEGDATGREWRTPPLWGIGTMAKVAGHRTLLHDGRARDADEAIRWHGGEAAPARRRYVGLSVPQRKALLAFLNAI